MRIVTAPRGGGKTKYLIDQLRRNPRLVMAVPREDIKADLVRRHPDLSQRLITHQQLIEGSLHQFGSDTEILIDELGMLLDQMTLGRAIGDITTSAGVTELNPQVIQRPHRNDAGQHYMLPPPGDSSHE